MSLARISQRLAAARQTAGTGEDRKEEDIEDFQAPHIGLSAQWQTCGSSILEKDSKPLPLEALGSLLFSLSGYMISTTKEFFNVSQLEKCSQVLLVVIDNMSTLDLEEKPSLLGRFRERAKKNGLSALVMPALAADHSTGSDLSQVRVNFQKDTLIIKHLLRETSGIRKLKAYKGDHRKKTSLAGTDEINFEDFASETESLEEAASEPIATDPTQRIKEFQLKFPRRNAVRLKQRLRSADSDVEEGPAKKKCKLDKEEENKTNNKIFSTPMASDPATSMKKENLKKLRELKRTLVEIQQKLRKLREQEAKDEVHQRKTRKKVGNLRRDFRSRKQEYELERAKCIQGEPKKNVSKSRKTGIETVNGDSLDSRSNKEGTGLVEANEEESGNKDLLKFIEKMGARSGLTLTPVGTVIDPGKLDRSKPEKFDRTLLLLSPSEMKAQGFILNYKPSRKSYTPVHSKSKLYGIDCEMCLTTNMTNELTRITVVSEDGVVLMDSLVKPRARIINYLTQFSGITAEMMQDVKTRKEAILQQLEEILPPDGILVGHSLESDLKALEITHPYCIDTSVCYSVKGSRQKSKLKVLMKTFLGEDIQVAGAAGHCSAEDSFSALKLVLLKLQNDISFGDIDLKGDLEWNGVDYDEALKDALRVVARERAQQGPFRNSWVRPNPQPWQSSTRMNDVGASSVRNPNFISKLESHRSRDGEYYKRKRELYKLIKERRRQERAMRDIKAALDLGEKSSRTIARKIMKDAYLRRKRERRARKEKSQVDTILFEKLEEVERKKKELLSLNGRSSNAQSLVVLLAKQKFLKQKLLDLEETSPGEVEADKKTTKKQGIMKKQLLSDLAKLETQIRDKEKDNTKPSETECVNDVLSEVEAADDEDDSSSDESEEIDSKTNVDTLTETEVLGTLVENESALEQLRRDEEILREELVRAAQDLRRAATESKIAAKHAHNEILAREILHGLVDPAVVFKDEQRLHNFIEYQLFVSRKNEEFLRKRGRAFGTVALDHLYLNMFTAWRSAGKKSVVVGDRRVAKLNYDRVDIQSPEDGSLSSTVKAARKCLRTHDLVVSHLTYDDVNENETSIERALDLLWERVKSAGVMIVLLEGTYHYKRLGHGLASLAIKTRESA